MPRHWQLVAPILTAILVTSVFFLPGSFIVKTALYSPVECFKPLWLLTNFAWSNLSAFKSQKTASAACDALQTTLPYLLTSQNTSIASVSYVSAGSTVKTAGSCFSSANVSSNVCRVVGQVNTTESSRVKFEMWLPDAESWYGRVMTVGNGGLNGCIDYGNLDYGSSFHFATIGSDNGHDGVSGHPFLNAPEVVIDYSWRSIHTIQRLSRIIAVIYYHGPPSSQLKSYYMGCSTGGRQGVQSALKFPHDFDGILAGAPAVDLNHLLGWTGMIGRALGAPEGEQSDKYIGATGWELVVQEVLRQCDALDGKLDGIVGEPDECQFDVSTLACAEGRKDEGCLTKKQVEALRKIYSPLVGSDEKTLLYPRFDPGAERVALRGGILGPQIFAYTKDWWRYAIYNDSGYMYDDWGVKDVEFADTINPGGVATWDGDLSEFRNKGGKLITYHGRSDGLIASGNSKRLQSLVSSTLSNSTHPSIEDFYRLFLIPGMEHCQGGPGAYHFGQRGPAALDFASNDSAHNALLALVDWVEGGKTPDVLIGTEDRIGEGESRVTRQHCRWPGWRSVWDAARETWICENDQ